MPHSCVCGKNDSVASTAYDFLPLCTSWGLQLGGMGWRFCVFICMLTLWHEKKLNERQRLLTQKVLSLINTKGLKGEVTKLSMCTCVPCLFSMCPITYVFKKGHVCGMEQVREELCFCLLARLESFIMCSCKVFLDWTNTNKNHSFPTVHLRWKPVTSCHCFEESSEDLN